LQGQLIIVTILWGSKLTVGRQSQLNLVPRAWEIIGLGSSNLTNRRSTVKPAEDACGNKVVSETATGDHSAA
jgi:hypothetical protein